ncbi:Probable methyltransferase At1g27930 [Linum perenne]
MPSEVFHFRSLVIPLLNFSSSTSPEPDQLSHPSSSRKFFRGGAKSMKFPARKLLPLLVFTLTGFSIFRLLRIAVTTSSTSSSTPPLLSLHPTLESLCSSESTGCNRSSTSTTNQRKGRSIASRLSKKEFKLLSNLVKSRAPCNLLIFGMGNQHLKLSSLNSGGKTLFLEDDSNKINKLQQKVNSSWTYSVEYPIPAEKAYQLLKHARESPECGPAAASSSGLLMNSTCRLALTTLPRQVYEVRWDVVVVDGPSGDSPEAPGRMSAIYMAGLLARVTDNVTDVVVHDTHRTIEKWFSWEFLCKENMVSSKGRLWRFEIRGLPDSERFCALV